MKWFDAHSDSDPPRGRWVWIQTKSGVVAVGHHDGYDWCTDGYRVLDAYEPVWYWAEITYPEGVRESDAPGS